MLLFVGDRRAHHSWSSGYDQLVRCFPESGCLSASALEQGRILWWQVPRDLRPPPATLSELRTRLAGCPAIWHLLYGDQSPLEPVLRSLAPHALLVVSVHQPAWLLLELAPQRLATLAAADVILTVSRSQALEVSRLGLPTPTLTLPYAIWTQAFYPTRPAATDGTVLIVGEHLRDWDFIEAVMAALGPRERVRWRLVVPTHLHRRFAGIAGIEIEGRLSEPALAGLYHRAALLLLPLVDATANTAVLEAMASGCPVVCNRLRAIEEYLGPAGCYFRSGDVEACLAWIRTLTMDPLRRLDSVRRVLERARLFDWAAVAPSYRAFYTGRSALHELRS